MGDHVLERDEEAAAADLHEPRQALRHLHPREPLLARVRVAHEHGEAERERRDVRERLAGPDGERREHRVDVLLEARLELRALLGRQVVDRRDDDALCGERRAELPLPEPRLALDQRLDALADLRERRARSAAVVRADVEPGGGLVEQPGDPHGEELVHVRGEERAVLHALEQRQARVGRLLEDAHAPVDPRQLAVEQPLGGPRPALRHGRFGRRSVVATTSAAPRACSRPRGACG